MCIYELFNNVVRKALILKFVTDGSSNYLTRVVEFGSFGRPAVGLKTE